MIPIILNDQNMKSQHYMDVQEEILQTQRGTSSAVVTSK